MTTQKAKLTIAQVAGLAGLPVATLRDWFNNTPSRSAYFHLRPGDVSAPAGGKRYVTDETALAAVIAARFTKCGVPLAHAAQIGKIFAYTNTGNPMRKNKGACYGKNSLTVIVFTSDERLEIFPVDQKSNAFDFLSHYESGATMLVVDPIRLSIEAAVDSINRQS